MDNRNPFYIRYRNNLKDCLIYISTNSKLSTYVDKRIISQIQTCQKQLESSAKLTKFSITIDPIELTANGLINCGHIPTSHLSFGGEVRFDNNGNFFQALSLCVIAMPKGDISNENGYSLCKMDNGKTYIIRRFHFDIDAEQVNGDRPVFHLQYGGNIQDKQKGEHQYELISSIDLPRIPTMPLDLVQTLNLVFSQINTDISSAFRNPGWRNIVLTNDKIWDDIYFSSMKNRSPKETLYEKLCSHNIFT